MKAPVTKLVLMIDESGSFIHCKNAMRHGFEGFRPQVAEQDGVTVDMWFFGMESRNPGMDVAEPGSLSSYDHHQRGNGGYTRLNECVVHAIDARLEAGLEMEASVLAVLITDGGNNHREFDEVYLETYGETAITTRLQQLRDSGQWTFIGFQPIGSVSPLPGFTETEKFRVTQTGVAKMWDKINGRLGDYLDARQGGTIPDHLL